MKKLFTAVILIACMLAKNNSAMEQTGSNNTTKYRKVPSGANILSVK